MNLNTIILALVGKGQQTRKWGKKIPLKIWSGDLEQRFCKLEQCEKWEFGNEEKKAQGKMGVCERERS
jgi:hypothetical protein